MPRLDSLFVNARPSGIRRLISVFGPLAYMDRLARCCWFGTIVSLSIANTCVMQRSRIMLQEAPQMVRTVCSFVVKLLRDTPYG